MTVRRVLFTDHTAALGGGERCLLDLLDALPAELSPVVACPSGPLADAVRTRGIAWEPVRGTAASLRLGPRTPQAAAELAVGGLALARIARRRGVDLVHHNSLRAGLMGALARRAPGAPPALVHLHDVLPPGATSRAVVRVLSTLDGALANSAYTARHFGAGTIPLWVTENPVDLERFDPARLTREQARAAAGLDAAASLVALVAQITPWKGQLEAIRALPAIRAAAPGALLLLAGEVKFTAPGSRHDNVAYLASLHTEVARLGLGSAVRFLGEREDVPALLAAADVLVMPSHEEPFGRIAAEAMAMGTATVATDRGGPPEFVIDGVTGRLVSPQDPAGLAAVVAELLGDPAQRARLGAAGCELVRARFGAPGYAAATLAAYEALLGRARAGAAPRALSSGGGARGA